MKPLFVVVVLLFGVSSSYSQDTIIINQIDSMVNSINASDLPVQRDTLVQDHPQLGLKTITYLATIIKKDELIKFVNNVNSTRIENGIAEQITSSNMFYFSQNKLIKVEEYLIKGEIKKEVSWYYADGKPLYYTLQNERAEERAKLLLEMGKDMVKRVIK
jgi:hypothetical protein